MVRCDENMIQSVVRNLISNAIKYSHTESSIEINISEYTQDDKQILVSIKDFGIGLSPEDTEKLFKIDNKIVSSKGTSNETGTGLGLILCKEFIVKHQCKI